MNDLIYQLDIAAWKGVAAALLLPTMPFLLLDLLVLFLATGDVPPGLACWPWPASGAPAP